MAICSLKNFCGSILIKEYSFSLKLGNSQGNTWDGRKSLLEFFTSYYRTRSAALVRESFEGAAPRPSALTQFSALPTVKPFAPTHLTVEETQYKRHGQGHTAWPSRAELSFASFSHVKQFFPPTTSECNPFWQISYLKLKRLFIRRLDQCFHLSWWLSSKESAYQCRERRFNPWVGKIPWRRKWQPTPVFLPGKSHGQRSLAGFSPWGRKSWT